MPENSNQIQIDTRTGKLSTNLFNNDTFIYFLLTIAMLFVFIARMHLVSFPFERDEGEYAYIGKLILDGHPPYTVAYNMKFPGTYYMFAIIMGIFGKSITGVHLGLTFITLASMLLVFIISRNFVSKIGAIISTTSFGILGTSWALFGQAAHATHFVTFFALLGIFIILQIFKSKKNNILKYFISGMFFSLAFICKQSGLFFLFFGFTIIIIKELYLKHYLNLIKKLLVFSLGFVTPVIIMFIYFYLFGNFNKFWFWTITYLSKYGEQVPFSDALTQFLQSLNLITANYTSAGYIAMWIIALVGIPFIFINKALAQNKIIVFSFFLFSFLTIIPGFYFREHYFITLLPAVAMLIAVFFEYFNNLFVYKLKLPNLVFINFAVFLFLIGIGISANTEYLFTQNNKESCKQLYGISPFVESIEIANYLEHNSAKDDKIAILGSEPQIYFYANRYSATGYIYTYNLLELTPFALFMQKEMALEIEKNKPKFIVFVSIDGSWTNYTLNNEQFIFHWADDYTQKNYRVVGFYNVQQFEFTSLVVGEQLGIYKPQSKDVIYIFEKIN